MSDLSQLPPGLPPPLDDGACAHLQGTEIPDVALMSTAGSLVSLRRQPGMCVLFCYPMTGKPGVALPEAWDEIPGARGCTPQACGFRDSFGEYTRRDISVWGMSVQATAYQREARERLHLPYHLLSDRTLALSGDLGLPTFEAGGMRLLKRVTLIVSDGVIVKTFYPVFPPDRSSEEVLRWLSAPR